MKKNLNSSNLSQIWLLLVPSLTFAAVASLNATPAFAQPDNANSNTSSKPVNTSAQGQAKKIKYKKDTKVDFDDELIEGGVKNPFQSMIGGRDGDTKQGFIKIRREWHDQMIMSVNGLSQ